MPNIPMMPSAYDPALGGDEVDLQRRQQLADLLRAQSMVHRGTQMVGNVAVKQSPLEGISKLFTTGMAGVMDKQITDDRLKLGDRQMAAQNAMAQNAAQSLFPSAQGAQGPTPSGAPLTGNPDMEAKQRQYKAAYLRQDKTTMDALAKDMIERTPDQKNWAAMNLDPREVGRLEMAKRQRDAERVMSPDQSLYGPDNKLITTAPTAPSGEVKTFQGITNAAGYAPGSPEYINAARAQILKNTTHQPPVSVSVNTEKGYAGHIAEGLAKQDLAVVDAAKGAPERVQNARMIQQLLDKNPITGTAAEGRLAFNRALATAGIVDAKSATATEDLRSALASSTLEAIKSSGLGAGQGFTNTDRDFLENAKAGKISNTSENIRHLAVLNERAALAAIDKGNVVIKKLKGNKNMGGVGSDMDEVQAPANTSIDDLVRKYSR